MIAIQSPSVFAYRSKLYIHVPECGMKDEKNYKSTT